jgi:uncharacterized protein YjbJ (UPF0337 family)
MNEDILKGKWKQLRGEAQIFWGDLTDDDFDQIEGSAEKLEGKLQERYGYTKEKARDEVNRFMDRMKTKLND